MTQYYRNTHKPCILYMYREDEGEKNHEQDDFIYRKSSIYDIY